MSEISTTWHSYPSLLALGHRGLAELLLDPVEVTEKIDGSFIGFGLYEDGLRVRSKGTQLVVDAPEKMFNKGVEAIKAVESQLTPGWMYCGEYLQKPKHNALAYDRNPNNHIMLFSIRRGDEDYLSYAEMQEEATRLGFEVVPLIYEGTVQDLTLFTSFLDRTSALGGQKIEGVVVKNYNRFGADKKILIGKFVSEAFKEVHRVNWKAENVGQKDILTLLGDKYKHPARWNKAIQHLKEAGQLDGSPKDIGPLIKEIPLDIEKECKEEIKEALWQWAWSSIKRIVTNGFPEYYKEQLLKEQFGTVDPFTPVTEEVKSDGN